MINIQDTKVFFYDNDRQTVTVYRDFDNANKWYIVPTPRFAMQVVDGSAIEEFSLVEYKTDQGTAGTCAFTVELTVSPEALQAVRSHLGHQVEIGQFDWVSAQAYLTYQLDGDDRIINVIPSMYGSNRAAFVIHLPDQEAVRTFKTAFGPGGSGVSTFRIDYDVLALSKLPAVNVKVKYDSNIAYEYEKTVTINKNVWGKETSRNASVKEYLKNSDAGSTDINWSIPNPGDELKQRVFDWAWVTLEGLVTKAMDDAMRRIGENNTDKFSMSQTASFERLYSENQVIEWAITPSTFLPSFNEQQWQRHFSFVDNQTLTVSFNILNDLKALSITAVKLSIDYPSKSGDNIFTPDSDSSWTFKAEGAFVGGHFLSEYQYTYEIHYEDQPDPATFGPFTDSATEVILPAGLLGIQTARFIGSNIDFEKSVDFLLLDLYFTPPDGQPAKVEQVKITDNTTEHAIKSRTRLPTTNGYDYQLTYVMKNKSIFLVAPISVFGAQNREMVVLTSPFTQKTYTFRVINSKDDDLKIIYVQVNGTYDDTQNGISASNMWDFEVPDDKILVAGMPWILNVVENPNASYIRYDGFVILSDGTQRPLAGIKIQTPPFINISALQESFTVALDPFQIAWDKNVTKVVMNMFTLEGNPGSDQQSLLLAEGKKTQIQSPVFTQGMKHDGQTLPTPEQYYTFIRPVGTEVKYYYSATYYHEDGTETYVDETSADFQRIVLPPDGTSATRFIHEILVPAGDYLSKAVK